MSSEISVGSVVGNYEIMRELGRGGMGIVYKANEQSLQRIVALKVLAPSLCDDPAFVRRFQREAKAAAQLSHPGIVPVYAIGEHNGLHYIAMEYIKGETLARHVRRHGRLEAGRACAIAYEIAEALKEAHRRRILHRDIKASNIMIDAADRARLMDFGLAKGGGDTDDSARSGVRLGTPHYMAPEQVKNGPIDARVDQYALGVTLFEMLTGALPFQGDTPVAVLYQVVHARFPAEALAEAQVPEPVARVVLKMTAKRPDDRYLSDDELIQGLNSLLTVIESGACLTPTTVQVGTLAKTSGKSAASPKRIPTAAYLVLALGVVVALLAAINFLGPRFEAESLVISDPVLAAAIADRLRSGDRRLNREDLLKVSRIDVPNGGVEDLTGLEHCLNLTELDISGNAIGDLNPLAGLTNLTVLRAGVNEVTDITPVANLRNLVVLELSWNGFSDLGPIAGLHNLNSLDIVGNQVRDLAPLSNLTELTQCRIASNPVKDLTPLTGLPHLLQLEASDIANCDLATIGELISLEQLFVADNRLTDLSPLAALTELKDLWIYQNRISDIGPLAHLPRLRLLCMAGNRVEDIAPLVANPAFAQGAQVYLTGNPPGGDADTGPNPLNGQSLNEYIPALRARGVIVHF